MQHSILALPLVLSAAGALCANASAQAWSDDFESYAAGSALETQGGWAGWDGVNTTFTVVTTAQANSGTQSIQPNPGSDTVQQFMTPPTTGIWVFEAWVYIPTGFSSALDFMIMNDYQDLGPYEWGSWLVFDGPGAQVTCNCGGFSANVVPMPYDRWVEVREVINLDTDLAEIYFDGTLFASYVWSGGYNGGQSHSIPSVEALDLYSTGVGSGMFIDDVRLYEIATTLGMDYCNPAANNSTGAPAGISAFGVGAASSNDVTLTASDLPNSSFGFFITSQTQGFVANPNGSAGNLCVSGAIGRYVGPGQIQNSGGVGEFSLVLDLTMTPQPTGFVSIAAGETWNFQAWYRDAVGGVPGSNFTNAVSVTLN